MEIESLFGGIYKDRVCLVTGDTGFKGTWLVYWLNKMGAKVIGYALEPVTEPSHYNLLEKNYTSIIGNLADFEKLNKVFKKYQPEIIFHLAAQALVRYSYDNPTETFNTNIMGTVNVFEASKNTKSVKAIVNVTSDKCYDNKEWIWGYRENDAMGGYDPYSASKGCAEIITTSYQKSFFNGNEKLLASGRAGNVIGGGDWSADRLIPDIIKSAEKGTEVEIRNPLATRPWQHVLEPLSGYLVLGWNLLLGKKEYAGGWNFGPDLNNNLKVNEVVKEAEKHWKKIKFRIGTDKNMHHEANLLMLDCSKANKKLKWNSVWDFDITIEKTILWYKDFIENDQINTENDLISFIENAKNKNAIWT
ncbi:CDP-glucose 4,6-dehydratase [uncultured Winogradskyella sp.]|uniref:CDP-glucose 4,6-dehydratase n=1 Tax=Winogradskyella sp. 4-2091 TaxID=3381659 RepID=UPI002627B3DE|nr:CDP-glucose 4,6-dehydratase [uncultured Winogradskyella sp.]